ncbi:primase-helicase zinc-binding domain-containing protein [Bartonella sp. HY038]|uniref:primase-helicase zinc-binding domain-containing protein n=1 Tax=Bartonella sp. HY038 TaxID=2759660 RepID=UPI0015F89EAC|nr:primase-helicase zinc-binding domain-containing protein [Bartonella sp. HY038]
MSGSIVNLFIDEAGSIKIANCVADLGLPTVSHNGEYAGPCPQCGGKDRFSYNIRKDVWNCRGCSKGGHSALSLTAHVLGLDLHVRADLIKAAETVLGRAAPKNEVSEEERLKAKWLFEQRKKRQSTA